MGVAHAIHVIFYCKKNSCTHDKRVYISNDLNVNQKTCRYLNYCYIPVFNYIFYTEHRQRK